jgi:hypothetical protein
LIGDEFIPLLNKSGGAGFQVTAYTQTWSDVEARIGSPAKAGQIAGNFNTLDNASGEGGRDRRAVDEPAARGARGLDGRFVVGIRHQRPG